MSKNFVLAVLALGLLVVADARRPGLRRFQQWEADRQRVHNPWNASVVASTPSSWDWRVDGGTNLAGNTLTQQNPAVCGSCWAEAATSALSDRFVIATNGRLRLSLAPQTLLNFNDSATGGTCDGGDAERAYDFAQRYGLVDDTCAPFLGVDSARGFEVRALTARQAVRDHECYKCDWGGTCDFIAEAKGVNVYSVDAYGTVQGAAQMRAEIFNRGPIACSLNSEAPAFDAYHGGIIQCPVSDPTCVGESDHVVLIGGFGVDRATGVRYWVGRNSYGTQWGEGAGGGWFRIAEHTLNIDTDVCAWAVPSAADVQRALVQFTNAL